MRPVFSRGFALALAALFLGTLALPSVVGDHSYSHRYIVYGRVIGSDGNPIPDASVNVGFDNKLEVESFCHEQPGTETDAWGKTTTRTKTNAQGEFFYCFHVHALSRGLKADAHAEWNGVKVSEPIDGKFRKNYLELKVPNATGKADADFDSLYLVSGRVWESSPGKIVEGVTVQGKTFDHVPVKIEYKAASGEVVTGSSTTNNYGDFAVRLAVPKSMGPGEISITAANETKTYDADVETRWTDVNFRVNEVTGSGLALKALGAIAVIGIVGGGGYYAYKQTAGKRSGPGSRKRAQR